MKITRHFLILLLVIGIIAFVSCSTSPGKNILGKWQGSEASLKANDSLPLNSATWEEGVNAHKHTFYTFKRDNTFTLLTEYKAIYRKTSGTWSICKHGKELTLVMRDYSVTNKVKLMEISNKKLTWIMNYPFGELSTTFVKVK